MLNFPPDRDPRANPENPKYDPEIARYQRQKDDLYEERELAFERQRKQLQQIDDMGQKEIELRNHAFAEREKISRLICGQKEEPSYVSKETECTNKGLDSLGCFGTSVVLGGMALILYIARGGQGFSFSKIEDLLKKIISAF